MVVIQHALTGKEGPRLCAGSRGGGRGEAARCVRVGRILPLGERERRRRIKNDYEEEHNDYYSSSSSSVVVVYNR